jgi:hypothetical protein
MIEDISSKIAHMVNDPRGLPLILEELAEAELQYALSRGQGYVQEISSSYHRLTSLQEAVRTWRSKWPNEWKNLVDRITLHFVREHLDYYRKWGLFRTVTVENRAT